MSRLSRLFSPPLIAAVVGLLPGAARAAVPTGYKGTPYMGTPQSIPGRVELANLDVGGEGVSYHADHRRINAVAEGYSPLSGDDYRPTELDLPDICRTNTKPPPDTWDKAGGLPYPSAALEHWYYIGLAHAVDWVKVTVNVKKAGKYWVSSNWASPNTNMHYAIYFNDGSMPAAAGDTHLDGTLKADVNLGMGTGDYHIWKSYPHFAMVDLSEGVQVMTFHLRTDHLQYGFLQFDSVDGSDDGGTGGQTDGGGTSGGTDAGAGAGGTTGTGGTPGTGGGAGGAGGSDTSGAGGTPPDPETGAGGSTAGTAGAAGQTTGTGGVPGTTAGTGGTGVGVTPKGSSGGCSCATAPGAGGLGGLVAVGILGMLVSRRRRRS
jgi:MYXO-CTERM domain-containing protein